MASQQQNTVESAWENYEVVNDRKREGGREACAEAIEFVEPRERRSDRIFRGPETAGEHALKRAFSVIKTGIVIPTDSSMRGICRPTMEGC